jgi:glycosyltransferase involved in cell wall biosynthesis
VISTRVGGVPSVLDEGQTGFLVAPGDVQALRSRAAALRSDPAATRICGERARAAAIARFSAERMQREYIELYARVLDREPWYGGPKRDVRDRRSL